MARPHGGRLPVGFVLARLEDPKAQQHALDLTLTATEGPRWATVVQAGLQQDHPEYVSGRVTKVSNPIYAAVGDRILVKQYTGYDVELVLPDTPETMRCELCNAAQDDPEAPQVCIKAPNPLGGYGPHTFVPKATPEPLLIVNLEDVLYVEPQTVREFVPISSTVQF